MKLLKSDYRKGHAKVQVENLEDLWYLGKIILPGDFVKGLATRKVEASGKDARSKNVKRQTVVLKIQVTKVEFIPKSTNLRVLGTIAEEREDMPKGSHQNIKIEEGSSIDIEKEQFLKYQIDYLKDASERKRSKVLLCAVEKGSAIFANLTNTGFEVIGRFEEDIAKKDDRSKASGDFFKNFSKAVMDYNSKYHYDRYVVGSANFWKSYLETSLVDLKSKTTFVQCNSVDENGINEILKRKEMGVVLKEENVRKEIELIDELFKAIGKEGNYSYGYGDVKVALNNGAISHLIIADSLITDLMENNQFADLDKIMKEVDKQKGKITLVKADHEGGQRLMGLGGIAALLRFKI
jgi:protein pelota